ncbi:MULTISPECIES: CvfB family protein [Brochothrix]|uniref:DNA-binding protein n=1 Tax=Brochothrix thermosphacta TaxID=2756 RepID=A0A291BV87_BROTH|nr:MULTISPECIES: S1-like domain-containing RNA-binding protein [Brochothrix]SLN01931.1 S1 RNA binding domain [Brachybacterium faecium]ATF25185.1 DNA-binding protein [Brochothrix thermosphacta]ATH84568.1 DNA-binding protein [Brochothrix thermosphacta]EUJ38541.1 RNA-binding domain-containing protein [Brochothrix thermosphacta DSM 20171 = FSL F6-1036]MBR5525231.1 DNA-binding protein [Brochothrix sp.]
MENYGQTKYLGTTLKVVVKNMDEKNIFVADGYEDVYKLPREYLKEDQTVELEEELEVFILNDQDQSVVATTIIPKVQIGRYSWGEVVAVRRDLGVFVNIGLPKDIVVSMDDMPPLKQIWPKKGDRLLLSLRVDQKDRLWGVLATEEVIKTTIKKAAPELKNTDISGTIYRLIRSGSFLITDEAYLAFVHETERDIEPRLGEYVNGRVVAVRPDGSLNISLRKRAHEALGEDAGMIEAYLVRMDGEMPYTDKSSPDEIKAKFGISKAQFKRALGQLMKGRKITQADGWTKLVAPVSETETEVTTEDEGE